MGATPTPQAPQGGTPPLPPGIRAQQGPLPGMQPPPAQAENAQAIIMRMGADARKLAESLVNSKPEALQTLKEIIPLMAQLTSEILGPEDKGDMSPAPPPTPGEVLPPPSTSAAPGGGYLPGA